MKNKTVSRVCLVILAVIFLGIVLIPSLIDLSGKNNESIKIKYAAVILELTTVLVVESVESGELGVRGGYILCVGE